MLTAANTLTALRGCAGGTRRLARRHLLLTILLVLGLALRVMATLAYYPALLYIDSFGYLQRAYRYSPSGDPHGYPWFLRYTLDISNLTTVAVIQHLFGLGMAVAIYALLRRYDVRRTLAALAVAPVLLDAYQVQIEQNILSDTLFETLVVAGIVVIAWSRHPRLHQLCLGAVLFGCAVVVRNAGDALALVVVLFPLLAVRGRRRKAAGLLVAVIGFGVPLTAYAAYNDSKTGDFSTSSQSSGALYGRAATIADCAKLPLTADERLLCPTQPFGRRGGVDFYISDPRSPLIQLTAEVRAGKVHLNTARLENEFAMVVIRHQPWDYTRAILGDFLHGFSVDSHVAPTDTPSWRWQFQTTFPVWPPGYSMQTAVGQSARWGQGAPSVQPTLARILRGYQLDGGSTPGPLLGLCALLGVGGCVAWSKRTRKSGLRPVSALLSVTALGLLLTSDAFEYSLRYQLPGIVLLPVAGALGLTALSWYRKPLLSAYPDDVDASAADAFRADHGVAAGDVPLAPVTVVIAAYNEQDGIADVLRRIPGEALGMPVDVLVVVDGASDGTARAAREAVREAGPIHVCDVPVNRGQGAALRLGYALARAGGAEYIVTTDADGQYDIEDVEKLLEPIVEDRADFVTGSRILGRQQTNDVVRRAGVHVFARLVSLLMREQVTDTSFGMRAMRAKVTEDVRLQQPQYQSSELLIGILSCGYRVLEVPMLMRVRSNGRSKKGNNLVYGSRYARVVLRTWWRERRPLKTRVSNSRNLTTNMMP